MRAYNVGDLRFSVFRLNRPLIFEHESVHPGIKVENLLIIGINAAASYAATGKPLQSRLIFIQLGFNEADMFMSSLILIYHLQPYLQTFDSSCKRKTIWLIFLHQRQ